MRGPEASKARAAEPLENLADVLAARRFLVEPLGRVSVLPVAGRRDAPIEERVSWELQEPAPL